MNRTGSRRRRLAPWLLALAVPAVVPAGCSDDTVGPLGEAAAAPRAACFETDAGGALTKHVGTFTPPENLRLLGLQLDGAAGVEEVEPVVLPFGGNPAVTGTFLRYPPGSEMIADSLMRWSQRQPLADAIVTEADGQLAVLVGLRLTDAHEDGHIEGFRIEYADADGEEFSREYPGRLILKAVGSVCTAADYD